MALDFPSSPTLNQVFTSGGRSWIWNGSQWIGNNAAALVGGTTGQVQVNNGNGFGAVSSGTSGQALVSAGAGVPPSFGTLGVAGGGTGATTLTGVVKGTGTSALTAGSVALGSEVTGTLPVANGGTGAATLAANNVLLGNGTSALQVVAPGTAGNVLQSNGSTWISAVISTGGSLTRSTKTSGYTLLAADKGNLIECTSGTFSLLFTAAATLASGWYCYLYNSGTGQITLDPNGSETIDGLTSYIMHPGEARLVMCSGSAFNTLVLAQFVATIDSTTTFSRPPGYQAFQGYLWAGGGAGENAGGNGGGGGACVPFYIPSTTFGASKVITIGAGGAATSPGVYQPNNNLGGNSSIAGIVTSYGGGGCGGGWLSAGNNSLTTTGGGRPQMFFQYNSSALFPVMGRSDNHFGGGGNPNLGTGGSPDYHMLGSGSVWGGGSGGTRNTSFSFSGGYSVYGGAGGAGYDASSAMFSAGGVSNFGGSGGTQSSRDGSVPGGGGAGGSTTNNIFTGAGGNGRCIIMGVL